MSGPGDFDAIKTAILKQTQDDTVVIAMLVGAGLESTWTIAAPGGGAFQITDARPGALLHNIDADVGYMLPRYQAAAAAHAADPESSLKYAHIAHDAEKPAQPYELAQGQAKVDSVYHTVVVNYGMGNAISGGPGQVASTNPFDAIISPVTDFLSRLTDVRLWRSLGWMALGIAFIVLGLLVWFRKPLTEAATTIAKASAE